MLAHKEQWERTQNGADALGTASLNVRSSSLVHEADVQDAEERVQERAERRAEERAGILVLSACLWPNPVSALCGLLSHTHNFREACPCEPRGLTAG